jgi:hypothetical protein
MLFSSCGNSGIAALFEFELLLQLPRFDTRSRRCDKKPRIKAARRSIQYNYSARCCCSVQQSREAAASPVFIAQFRGSAPCSSFRDEVIHGRLVCGWLPRRHQPPAPELTGAHRCRQRQQQQ